VQIDALALRLRPRTPMEAADLGVRLCQHAWRPVFQCYALVAVPVIAMALASVELAAWLPGVLIWLAKPWLDRTILFVLSRAAFGQSTTPGEVWRSQREIWWRQFPFTLTARRVSLWRSLTNPVYQLEGLSIRRAGVRVRQVRRRTMTAGMMVTHVFAMVELALALALMSLVFWLTPPGFIPDYQSLFTGNWQTSFALVIGGAYAAAVFVVEPFYTAAGFALYLSRRADLEAWDIEQEFRRAFAA
jgi:hypothetical protein